MNILLLFPPHWDLESVYPSLPTLTSFLRNNGHDVVQRDINIELNDLMLSKSHLLQVASAIPTEIKRIEKGKTRSRVNAGKLKALRVASVLLEMVLDDVEVAKAELRRPDLEIDRGVRNQAILQIARKIISSPFYPSELRLRSYVTRYKADSISGILSGVRNRTENIYAPVFTERVIPWILEGAFDLIGISLAGESQLIPGLTLARLIKESGCETHITVGGPMLAYMNAVLLKSPDFFSCVDSAVIGEGEHALLELAENLKGGNFEDVPNLIYRDTDGSIQKSKTYHQEDVNSLPTPDCGGLELDLYLSGHRVLPLLTARGCSWGRCAFCSACSTYGNRYRPRKMDLVIEDIRTLVERHDCRYFCVNDETVPPARLEMLSQNILESGIRIIFSVLARFEKGFTSARFEKAFEAGCRWISWGLESSSSRILTLMDKGISPAVSRAVLADSCQAEMWNNIYVLFGFPTETREEARETIDFIADNEQHIDTVFFDVFRLEGESKVWRNPDFYCVDVIDTPQGFFGPCYQYKVSSGMNRQEIFAIVEECNHSTADSHLNRFNYLGLSTMRLLVLCDTLGKKELRRYILGRVSKRLQRTTASNHPHDLKLRAAPELENARIPTAEADEEPSQGQSFLVFNRSTGDFVFTNSTGTEILKLLERERTYDELIEECEKEFGVSGAQLHQDISQFLAPLIKGLHVQFENVLESIHPSPSK
jgi:anaerobic magnesium-protoporphyrin IX monomethyl ester cyclase